MTVYVQHCSVLPYRYKASPCLPSHGTLSSATVPEEGTGLSVHTRRAAQQYSSRDFATDAMRYALVARSLVCAQSGPGRKKSVVGLSASASASARRGRGRGGSRLGLALLCVRQATSPWRETEDTLTRSWKGRAGASTHLAQPPSTLPSPQQRLWIAGSHEVGGDVHAWSWRRRDGRSTHAGASASDIGTPRSAGSSKASTGCCR